MRLIRLASASALALALAACGTSPKGSVLGSEGGALKGPEFAIRGKTEFDQRWIDETTEAGIEALGWKRPAPRPAEWDKPLARNVVAPAPVKKKKRWLNLLRREPVS